MDKQYIKMCDCPEIQGKWEPKVGDYVWRKYTIFGEELDRTVWPDEKMTEVVILHFKSSVEGYFQAVNAEGDERIFHSEKDIHKSTSIFLPTQAQLQEMCGERDWLRGPGLFLQMFHPWVRSHADEDDTYEQLTLRFVMHALYNKDWNGSEWI